MFFLSFILSFPLFVFGQEETNKEKVGRPDIPGTFLAELGFNMPLGASDDFDAGFFGSRTINIYYQYDIPLFESRFVFSPGIGFGLDRFKFKNNYTMDYESGTDVLIMTKSELDISKSQLITDYLDVPIELRYINNPSNPSGSFKVAVGFRAGVLFSSFTKIKYKEDSETIKEKTKRNWNLNNFRYGVYGKIGVGNVSLFGYYNLSTLFKNGEGPDGKDINNLTFGISFAVF